MSRPKRARVATAAVYAVDDDQQNVDPSTFNPVYPYGNPGLGVGTPTPMPPFYNSTDFNWDGGVLSIRVKDPIQRTGEGLGLKLGTGLALDAGGALTCTCDGSGGTPTDPTNPPWNTLYPLAFSGGNTFVIYYAAPLYLNDNQQLDVRTKGPLILSTFDTEGRKALMLNTGPAFTEGTDDFGDPTLELAVSAPLKVDTTSKTLTLSYGAGLQMDGSLLSVVPYTGVAPVVVNTDRSIRLRYGDGLQAVTGANGWELQTVPYTASNPIQISDRNLSLNLGSSMQLINNQLSTNITASAPLSVSGGSSVNLRLGNGVTTSTDTNSLTLTSADPITITEDGVGLRFTTPLAIVERSLELRTANPFGDVNGQLTLKLGNGLQVDSTGNLVPFVAGPITLSGGGIGLRVATPLIVSSGTDPGPELDIDYQDPIYVTNKKLALKSGGGLAVDATSGNLQISTGDGVKLSADDKLTLSTGPGLTTTGGNLALQVGSGLSFQGDVLVANPATVLAEDWTLWTTNDPTVNVTVGTSPDPNARMFLHLTKVGGIILGSARLQSITSSVTWPTTRAISVVLRFDSTGALSRENSGLSGQWGFRQAPAGVTEASPLDARLMMPDLSYY